MNRSTPGLPVHHQLWEFTQIHVHLVGDAIQPSHPLSSSSSPAPNPSQHQSLFQWVNSAWGGQSTGVSAYMNYLILITTLWSKYTNYPHFKDKEWRLRTLKRLSKVTQFLQSDATLFSILPSLCYRKTSHIINYQFFQNYISHLMSIQLEPY